MYAATTIALLMPLMAVCLASPVVTEEQLRSLIQPVLDAHQRPTVTSDSPGLFGSLAAVSPLDQLDMVRPTNAAGSGQASPGQHISPANQQLGQLNLAGGLTSLVKNILGSLRPPAPENPATNLDPLFGTNTRSGGVLPAPVPAPAPVQPSTPQRNLFNPLSFLFPGNGGPFGMLMPSMMMRMMETLMELF